MTGEIARRVSPVVYVSVGLFCLLFAQHPVYAQAEPASGTPLTLEQCIDLALAHNPRLAAAAADVRAASAGVDLARSAGGLHASIGGQLAVQGPSPTIDLPGRPSVQVQPTVDPSLGVTFELPIDTSGELDASRDAARAGRDAATARLDQVRDQVVYEVIRAYLAVLQAETMLAPAEQALAATQEGARVEQLRQDEGMATPLDVRHALSALRRADERLSTTRTRRESAMAALRSALGCEIPADATLVPTFLAPDHVPDPLESIAAAEARRPEMSVALAEIRRAAADLRSADAQDRVKLALTGGATAQSPSLITEPLSGRIGLGLSWPLLDHGREDALIGQAEARTDQTESAMAEMRDAIELQVQQSIVAMADADVRMQVCDDLVLEAETAAEDARQALRAGAITKAALLEAEARLADARAAKTLSKLDMSLAYAMYARATGRLTELFLAPTAP